jgi:putative transposon-encoded protein
LGWRIADIYKAIRCDFFVTTKVKIKDKQVKGSCLDDATQVQDRKKYKHLEFETTVARRGNSGHISLPKNLIGRKVLVSIQVLS